MLSRWDHNRWDTDGIANTSPVRYPGPDGNEGLILEAALAYEDPDIEPAGPRIMAIDVEYHETETKFDSIPQADRVTPEIQ